MVRTRTAVAVERVENTVGCTSVSHPCSMALCVTVLLCMSAWLDGHRICTLRG